MPLLDRASLTELNTPEDKAHDSQIIDNIDAGKTHEYFRWVAKKYAGPGRVKGRPRFVM